MDKIKQNGFWIAVGATVLVLVGLLVFLVFLPLGTLAESRAKLEDKIKQIQAGASRKRLGTKQVQPATKKYKDFLVTEAKGLEDAKQRGVDAYIAASKRYKLFFDDAETAPALAEFSGKYRDELNSMIKAYREKFGIPTAVAEGQDPEKDAPPPKIDRVAEQLDSDEKVPAIMKEFWFVQEVFKACEKLNLGGLKSIGFGGRFDPRKEALPYHALLEGTVQIEMSPRLLEDLMTELYSSDRVLFRVDELSYRRLPEGVARMAPLEHPKAFKDSLEASKVRYKDEISEPPVVVDMRLAAFEFTTLPAEPTAKPQDTKDPKDTGKKPSSAKK